MFQCPICYGGFSTSDALGAHLTAIHKERSIYVT